MRTENEPDRVKVGKRIIELSEKYNFVPGKTVLTKEDIERIQKEFEKLDEEMINSSYKGYSWHTGITIE